MDILPFWVYRIIRPQQGDNSAYCTIDTRVREYDGVVWLNCLFLYLALRLHTRSEERAIWYPLVQLDDFADGTMDTRLGNMLLHCSTTYILVSMSEYDGVVLIDRLFLHFALRRHTRSEARAIWYPLVQQTILHTAQWIPTCASMTVRCDSISLSSRRKKSQPN